MFVRRFSLAWQNFALKKVLDWIPPSRKRIGRPAKSWIDGIRQEIRICDLPGKLWQDRYQWRLGVAEHTEALEKRHVSMCRISDLIILRPVTKNFQLNGQHFKQPLARFQEFLDETNHRVFQKTRIFSQEICQRLQVDTAFSLGGSRIERRDGAVSSVGTTEQER
ncbi:unnamed protein product [Bemisia tabaci]|uniref:Uncharacterized protein n=1 Tax=Bemisia tabaci TaxID=7038 RepID=A0A9P0AF59_BEMTA|nr:unnamed protein product [Bemisia tabaci]